MAQQEETSNLSIDSPMDGKGGSMSVHRTGHIKHTLTDRFYLGTCFWTVFCSTSTDLVNHLPTDSFMGLLMCLNSFASFLISWLPLQKMCSHYWFFIWCSFAFFMYSFILTSLFFTDPCISWCSPYSCKDRINLDQTKRNIE